MQGRGHVQVFVVFGQTMENSNTEFRDNCLERKSITFTLKEYYIYSFQSGASGKFHTIAKYSFFRNHFN